jgi:hypothetical protein
MRILPGQGLRRDAVSRLPVALLALILAVSYMPLGAFAQVPTGSIEGVVTDSNGAAVPDAKITVVDKTRGRTFTTTSSSRGAYVVSALLPSEYEVKAEAPNFKTGILRVKVDVGKSADGNIALQVGAITESVSVTANEDTVTDVNQATVSGVINAKKIDALPINGRNFLDLAQLEPGVQTVDGGNFDPTKNGFTGVSIAGAEGRTTRIQVDGIDTTDENVGTTLMNYSMDAIQEFQISTFSLDPSTSLSNTGAINIATKSGTNDIHGSGFLFWRDAAFAARAGVLDAPFNRQQGGGRAGGPIIKDKLFWFINYEQNRTRNSVGLLVPAPFSSLTGFAAAPFDERQGTARADYNPTDRLHLFFRFSHDDFIGVTGFGGANLSPFQNRNNANTTVAGVDYTMNHFTHSFRYGHVNFANYIDPAAPSGVPNLSIEIAFQDTGVGVGPNLLAPQHTLQTNNEYRYDGGYTHGNHSIRYGLDYNRIVVNVFAAFFGNAPQVFTNSTTNLAPGQDPTNPLSYTPSEIIFGNGLGFFSDKSNHGYPFGGIGNNRIAWYGADTWKARHNLTLNFGVRYEYDPGQVNSDLNRPAVFNDIAPGESRKVHLPKRNFGPTLGVAWDITGKGTTVVRAGGGLYYETNIFNNVIFERADLLSNTIAPAFPNVTAGNPMLFGPNGEIVFNFNSVAGLPLSQSMGQILAAQAAFQALSKANSANFPGGPISIFPPGGLPGTQNTGSPLFSSEYAQPYSIQSNIGVQHKLGNNWLIQADYVRNRGVHTFLVTDINRVGAANTLVVARAKAAIAATEAQFHANTIDQAITAGALLKDFVGNGLGAYGAFPGNDPNFGNLFMIGTRGLSTYNGLLIKVNGRTGDFHNFINSATWGFSYALSRFKATQGDQAFAQFAVNNDCVSCLYGPNSVDRTHQFTLNTLMEFPWGINLATITHWGSALPVTLLVPNEGNGAGEIFVSDVTGTGGVSLPLAVPNQPALPGTNIGSYGRGVNGVSGLNSVITNFNNNFGGKLTPAGQALVNAGLFTSAQLAAIGAVIPTLALAPPGQVHIDSFWTTDFRLSKVIKVGERFRIEPSADLFNVFNKQNFDPPVGPASGAGPLIGQLNGAPGSVNGTLQGQRINKYGLGGGSFSPGIPRAFQFGIRVNF